MSWDIAHRSSRLPGAPSPSAPRKGKGVGVAVALAVMLVCAALGASWLLLRPTGGPQSGGAESAQSPGGAVPSGEVPVSASIPWALEGQVRGVRETITPSDSWMTGSRRPWTLDTPAGEGVPPRYATNGEVLITLHRSAAWTELMQGWDIRSGQARHLWSRALDLGDTLRIQSDDAVWVGDTLFVDKHVINGATGEAVVLSWLGTTPSSTQRTLVVGPDRTLVACARAGNECQARDSEGNLLWKKSIGLRSKAEVRGTATLNGEQWIWLQQDNGKSSFVNTATGAVNTLDVGNGGICPEIGVADGWLVACGGGSQMTAFAADGGGREDFDASYWPISTRSSKECSDATVPIWGPSPTLDQAIAFYRDGDTSATAGTLTALDCDHLEYRAPGTGGAISIDITDDPSHKAFTIGDFGKELQRQLAVSEGRQVLAIGNSMLIDLASGQLMDLVGAGSPQNPRLVAPGLVIAAEDSGICGAVPRD